MEVSMQTDQQLIDAVRAFISDNHMSIKRFAEHCGIGATTMTDILNRGHGIGIKSRKAMIAGLGVPVVYEPGIVSGHVDAIEIDGFRVRRVTTADGERWHVAQDVCEVLEIVNASDTTDRLLPTERGHAFSEDAIGRQQRMIVVNDAGLNWLMMRGNAERAQAFQRKLAHVVVPAIQKQGGYVEDGSPLAAMIASLLSKIEAMEAQPKALHDPASIIASKIDKLSPTVQQIVVAAAYGIKPEARSVWTATDIAGDLKDRIGLFVSPQTLGKVAKANGVQCPEVEQQNEYGYWAETWRKNEHGAAKVVPQYQYNKAGYDRLFEIFGNAGRLPFSG
jgi:prophage antirepressor-like protein